MSTFLMLEAQAQANYWRQRALTAERKLSEALAAATGTAKTAKRAKCKASQSGSAKRGNAQ